MIYLNKKQSVKQSVFILIISLVFLNTWIFAQSSTNYRIQKYVMAQGGNHSSSMSYKLLDVIGQPTIISRSTSISYRLYSGFLTGRIYPTAVDETLEMALPTEFKLLQNYPNPFNPETAIEYHVPVQSEVLLSIYDVRGQLVTKFKENSVSAGVHSVEWDGRDQIGNIVATGVYIYRIEMKPHSSDMNVFTEIRKMTLMK